MSVSLVDKTTLPGNCLSYLVGNHPDRLSKVRLGIMCLCHYYLFLVNKAIWDKVCRGFTVHILLESSKLEIRDK